MGGKKRPSKSEKFDKEAIISNGLTCPFTTIVTDEVPNSDCHPVDGWHTLGSWRQHILRKHGYIYGCSWCGESWTGTKRISMARDAIESHHAVCSWGQQGERNWQATQQTPRLSSEQQDLLDKVGTLRGEKELRQVYEACGIAIPVCYHVGILARPISSPAITISSPVKSTSVSTLPPATRGLLQGYQLPEVTLPGEPLPTFAQRITPDVLNQAQAAAQSARYHPISGQDAAKDDRDSGYGASGHPDEYIDNLVMTHVYGGGSINTHFSREGEALGDLDVSEDDDE
ncbi:hypothetical protein S40293_10729 [Stachybotrys chartarum IBT 40293]|nr:hypothetical protein S40293_10729 [Stachybotrys chartarum IBT 40293]